MTAEKRAQLLGDVPASVQAFTGDTLQKTGVTELSDLIRYIPGASQGISNSIGYQTYQIRGTGVVTGDATVGYYLDEAAFSLLGSNVAPYARAFDLDRVEVLRGPQGTLYGLSAVGGAIRFITADPNLHRIEARTQTGYYVAKGGDPGYFGDVAVSVPLVEDKLAARFAVDYEHKGGYVEVTDFPGEKNLDPSRIQNFRGKLLWDPMPGVVDKLTYQHNEVKQDFGTLLVSANPPVGSQGTGAGLGSVLTKYDMVSNSLSWDVGPGTIESSTGYLKWDLDQTAFFNIGGPVQAVQTGAQPTFTQELRYVSNEGGPIDFVAGGFYKHAKSDGAVAYSGAFTFASASTFSSDNYALFSEASTKLLDGKLVPLVGVRYSWDDRKFTTGSDDQSATFKAFTPRFNLSYAATRDQLYYLNIARGFRSGLFNTPALVPIAQGLGVPAQNAVSPDSLWSYEVGTKGDWGRKFTYDFAVYHTDWKDVQIIVSPQPGLGVTVNAGHAIGNGIDYGVGTEILRGLTLNLTGNYNDTKLRGLPAVVANASPSDGLYNGARMPYSPHLTNTIAINADQPLYEAWRFLGNAAYSRSSGTLQVNSGLTSDTLALLSARIGVRKEKLSVLLFGDNLNNSNARTYREYGLVNRPYPRTIGIQANYDY